jgi:hypothetical protein
MGSVEVKVRNYNSHRAFKDSGLLIGKVTAQIPVDEITAAIPDDNITDRNVTVEDIRFLASVSMSWRDSIRLPED